MSKKRYFYDSRREEVCTKKDPYMPPETYFELGISKSGNYVDTYIIGGREISFEYSPKNSWKVDYTIWYQALKSYCESNGVDINRLILVDRRYPKEEFIAILKEYGYKWEE